VEKDVSRDQAAAMEMIHTSGQRGVPVITIDDQVVVGFDRPRLEQLLAQPGVAPGGKLHLGLSVADAEKHAGMPGAYVGRVKPNTAGDRAGLRAGDVIIALNGRPVGNAAELEAIAREFQAGQRVPVVYSRTGQTLQTVLSL
jgi:S1-C subfamily serine protease